MQKYFQEKNAMQEIATNNKLSNGEPMEMPGIFRSDDIYGKTIKEFRQRPDLGGDHVPLIFWLITGFFRYKMAELKRFFTTGLFRVTSSD